MRVLFCGSRNWKNVYPIIRQINLLPSGTTVITGGARGADQIAHNYAKDKGLKTEVYEAEWKKLGKSAGPIRNKRMLDEGKPEKVYAFALGDSPGTNNMVALAQEAGIPVVVTNG